MTSTSKRPARLCASCEQLDFGEQNFRIRDSHAELEARARSCCFCNFRLSLCRLYFSGISSIVFDRIGSNLHLGGRYPPVLTVHRGRGMFTLDMGILLLSNLILKTDLIQD